MDYRFFEVCYDHFPENENHLYISCPDNNVSFFKKACEAPPKRIPFSIKRSYINDNRPLKSSDLSLNSHNIVIKICKLSKDKRVAMACPTTRELHWRSLYVYGRDRISFYKSFENGEE